MHYLNEKGETPRQAFEAILREARESMLETANRLGTNHDGRLLLTARIIGFSGARQLGEEAARALLMDRSHPSSNSSSAEASTASATATIAENIYDELFEMLSRSGWLEA